MDHAKLAMRIISHVKEDNCAEVLRRLSRRGKKKTPTKTPSCIVVSSMFFQCFRCVCATVSTHKPQLTVIVGKRSSCKHLQGSRSGSVDEALGIEEQVGPSGWSCLHGWRSWRGRKSSWGGGSGYCVGHSRVHPRFLGACSAQRCSAAPQIHRLLLFSCDLDRHRSLRARSRFHRIGFKKQKTKTNQAVAVGPASAARRGWQRGC